MKYPKPKTRRDKAYKDWISSLPCIFNQDESRTCKNGWDPDRGRYLNDPHHVEAQGNAGKGVKTDDWRCIPLCHHHHVELHQMGSDSFLAKYGSSRAQIEEVILSLNKIWEEMSE